MGDQAVEFLDVREAALVSVTEALARRALPWQAQLCPRALQDLEVARVRVRESRRRRSGTKGGRRMRMRGRSTRHEGKGSSMVMGTVAKDALLVSFVVSDPSITKA